MAKESKRGSPLLLRELMRIARHTNVNAPSEYVSMLLRGCMAVCRMDLSVDCVVLRLPWLSCNIEERQPSPEASWRKDRGETSARPYPQPATSPYSSILRRIVK